MEATRASRYDQSKGSFDQLTELLQNTREALQLEDDAVFHQTINALESKFEVERAILQGYAKAIARAYTERAHKR